MKKRNRILSILLAATMLTGTVAAMPLSVGAVSAVSDGTVSANVWQDVNFSDILTEDMTSAQIAEKLVEVGISKRSGNVTYSFRNGKLVIAATSASYLDLARDSSLKSAQTVETSLGGVALQSVSSSKAWGFMLISGADSNCYKMQFKTYPNGEDYYYVVEPATKVGGTHLTFDGSTYDSSTYSSSKSLWLVKGVGDANVYREDVKTAVDVTVSVDRQYGLYTYLDGQLATTMRNSSTTLRYWGENAAAMMNDFVSLGINAGATIELESVRVRERMPELTVTEVMTNGVTAVEVYNSTLNQVNVYDHCLYVAQGNGAAAYWQANSNGNAVGSKWGTLTETIAYPIAGEYTYNYTEPSGKDGTDPTQPADVTVAGYENSVTLSNPAYEDGVLNPGECAVLYIPTHAIGKSELVTPKTLESFRTEYGIASKVFYCYSNRDLAIGEANGYAQLGIGRVTFEGDDKTSPTVAGTSFMRNQPAAPAIRSTDYGIYDSFVTVNANDSEKTLRGVKYPTTGNTANSSAEFLTKGRFGEVKYPSGTARTVNGAEVLHSLGTVLDEQKLTFTSTLTNLYGQKCEVTLGIGETQTLPVIAGAEWKNAKGETVTEIAANTEDSYTQVTDRTVVFCGAQATKTLTDGTYSVRLIAVVDSIDFDAVGFEATVSYGDGKNETVTGECHYVYTSILGDGVPYDATDFGGRYFVVLHVDGIPAAVTPAEWTVRVYTVSGGAESDGISGSVTVNAPLV